MPDVLPAVSVARQLSPVGKPMRVDRMVSDALTDHLPGFRNTFDAKLAASYRAGLRDRLASVCGL